MSKRNSKFLRLSVAIVLAAALTAASPPRVININQGSEAGWIPSEELEAEMVAAAMAYWQYEAEGNYEMAYAMHSPKLAELQSFADYQTQKSTMDNEAGVIVSRDVYKKTWTHGASFAPTRGTYLAIDFSAKYERAQKVCGYIIVHRKTPDGPMEIIRTETNYMLDASFRDAEAAKAAWRKVSAFCPNYVAE